MLPLPAGSIALSLNQLAWPPQMQMQSVPLSEIEQEFFISHPGTVAQENRFQFQDISGSLLLVSSPTWRAHHPPELCYISSGFQLNHMERQQLTPSILGRWLALDHHTRSAAYWFQSVDRTTDDYLSRIWGEVTRKEQTWTMVSILFDQTQTPSEPAVQAFLNAVHEAIGS
ncbi:hypothetical protein C7B61_22080 [filamentous cyanobacterium CCP1]|nr:hypothetical protein C7B61_22080 [filamentous cyanobacterium CCP1]